MEPQEEVESTEQFAVSPAVIASVALATGALGLVGLSGDVLTRAVRNHPYWIAGAISAVIVVVAGLVVAWEPADRQKRAAVGVGSVAAVLTFTILVSAWAVGDRERPSISLSRTAGETTVSIKLTASGAGLETDEDWLVQVQAIEEVGDDGLIEPGCWANRRERYATGSEPIWPGPLLLWQQAGPDSAGDTVVEAAFDVEPDTYAGLCALITLRGSGDRTAMAYLSLDD